MLVDVKTRNELLKRGNSVLKNSKYIHESASNFNNVSELNTNAVLSSPFIKVPKKKYNPADGLEESLLSTPLDDEMILYPAKHEEKVVFENLGLDIGNHSSTYVVKNKNNNIKAVFSIHESGDKINISYMDVSGDESYINEALVALSMKPNGYKLKTKNVYIDECVIPFDHICTDADDSIFISLT